MKEGKSYTEKSKSVEQENVFSKIVRAGNRTYFFDVKATRKNEYYLVITESKKQLNKDGRPFFKKYKIFLYKEDFEKFQDGLEDVLGFIQSSNNLALSEQETCDEVSGNLQSKDFPNVDFEDMEVSAVEGETSEE